MYQQLNVSIKPSVYMLGYLLFGHGLAITAVFLLQISFYLQITLLLGLLGSLFYGCLVYGFFHFCLGKHHKSKLTDRIVSIRFNYHFWLLVTADQEYFVCRLEGDSVVFPILLALRFQCVKTQRYFSIALFPDSADRESLRNLRIMLKFRPENFADTK